MNYKRRKKSKVFIGLSNTANNSNSFELALRSVGIKADFYSWSNIDNPFNFKESRKLFLFENPPVRGINRLLIYLHFIRILFYYNTFIFNSPRSILSRNKDLPILKFLKKKVIFIFCGCTERKIDFDNINKNYICNRCIDDLKKKSSLCFTPELKAKRIRKLENYSNYIISQSDSAGYLNKIKPVWFYVISEKPNSKNYLEKFENDVITLVHFPSNPKIKLSHIIIPVMERLEEEFSNVEIMIKSKIPHSVVLDGLEKSHILIDALGLGYGSLAVEAMSRGCIVLTEELDWIIDAVPECPVVTTSSKRLHEDLIRLISSKQLRINIAQKSINFYYKYHSPEITGKYYKNVLDLN